MIKKQCFVYFPELKILMDKQIIKEIIHLRYKQ